ncbi:MAG: HD domain-containing protein [Thermodesulfobacteriota bacterium]
METDWTKTIRKLFEAAAPYLAARGDEEHTRVAHQMALYLLEKEGGDRRVVEPAVILHDVGWSTLKPEQIRSAFGVRASGEEARRLKRLHETNGAVLARGILETLGYDPGLTDRIAAIIETHDTGRTAESLEEKLVKDADKLWRYSRIGFWKEQERQGVTAEELYRHRVKGLGEWFFTPSAAALAAEELKARAQEIAARAAQET